MRIPIKSSPGSSQNTVPLAPPHMNLPTQSAARLRRIQQDAEPEAKPEAVAADMHGLTPADQIADHHVDGHADKETTTVLLASVGDVPVARLMTVAS